MPHAIKLSKCKQFALQLVKAFTVFYCIYVIISRVGTMNQKIFRSGWRFRKAYWTATVVGWRYWRLFLVAKILGKGYLERRIMAVHTRNAAYIKDAILELQGLFIKVGQLLSIMTNFLPDAFHEPLESLQDQIPARPFSEVRQRIEAELGQPLEAIFLEVAEVPLAAASIGQAHRARLKDGTEVVIKVQHKHIEQTATVDLSIILRLTRILAYLFDIKGIEYVYTQVQKMITEELDFRHEATAMQRIRENLKTDENIVIPILYEEFCTGRVLVTRFCEGVKITNTEQLAAWNVSQHDLAERLVRLYCKMVLQDGFYHADPHPGNILVQPDGKIVLLDFGAVATLDAKTQQGIPKLIEATLLGDVKKLISVLSDLGFIAKNNEAEATAQKLLNTLRHFLQNEMKGQGLNFQFTDINPLDTELYKVQREIGIKGLTNTFQVPKDYVLLNRTTTLLLGICNTLDPLYNPFDTVSPYIKEFIVGEKRDWTKYLTGIAQRTATTLIALPDDLRRTLNLIENGEVRIQISDINTSAKIIYQLGQQLIFLLLSLAAATFAYLFFDAQHFAFARFATFAAVVFLFLLFRSIRRGRSL
jgi:ubiquinone biosynthesis protein